MAKQLQFDSQSNKMLEESKGKEFWSLLPQLLVAPHEHVLCFAHLEITCYVKIYCIYL